MRGRSRWLASLAFALGIVLAPVSNAEYSGEYELKAKFVQGLTRFIDWPKSDTPNTAPFNVCVVAKQSIVEAFKNTLANIRIHDRKVALLDPRVKAEIRPCQILFIARDEDAKNWLGAPKSGPAMLTVGDSERFIQQGGMVRFFPSGRQLRFEISPKRARQEGLTISSKLLRLARIADTEGDH